MWRLRLLRLAAVKQPSLAVNTLPAFTQCSEAEALTVSGTAPRTAAIDPWFTTRKQWFSQCSCPGLGGPPPDKLFIEYDPDDVEKFIALADGIEEELPGLIVEGNVSGEGRPASFEVTVPDGTLVFSKLEQGRLPTVQEVVAAFSTES